MTIGEVIALADRMRPNQFATAVKISWLSKLDGMVYNELYATHDGSPVASFAGYNAETDMDTELLVPEPYAEDVYNNFMQAQIARENGEDARYNQAIVLYNNAYKTFFDFWNRSHAYRAAHTRFRF